MLGAYLQQWSEQALVNEIETNDYRVVI